MTFFYIFNMLLATICLEQQVAINWQSFFARLPVLSRQFLFTLVLCSYIASTLAIFSHLLLTRSFFLVIFLPTPYPQLHTNNYGVHLYLSYLLHDA